MMQIAMITPWMTRCGIYTYSKNLANALADLGHEIYIVRLPRFGHKIVATLDKVVESIPIDKVDLIHCQHEYGLYQELESSFYAGLKSLGKPLVTTMHAVGKWDVDRLIATTSTKIIVHNQFCLKNFGYPKNTVIIPHGATPLKTPPPPRAECKKSLGIDVSIPMVGYLGFISSYKGLEILIEAMTKVPEAALLIGGGWHTETETQYIYRLKEQTLRVLPGRCSWLGFVSDEDMSRVYASMDIFVYPSRYATESGALLTALSHRKTVLASSIPPFKEKEKVGALMTFKSVRDLTRKIKRLLKDEELRHTLEEGARKYTQETSWGNVAVAHKKLYEDVLANKVTVKPN